MGRFYRSVWISDTHLCTRDCQADVLLNFLDTIRCDYLYLVGDIIDVWALRKKWYWPKQYNEVVHKLLKRSRKGAKVYFVPGNHDEMFRDFVGLNFGDVEIIERVKHKTADGRTFLVLHGDEFDTVVRCHNWLSRLGGWFYHYLIWINRVANFWRRKTGRPYWSLAGAIKRRVKQAVQYLTNYEGLMVAEGKRCEVDGVICGHVHQPTIQDMDGILYCNTGDWIESCTALVEHEDGQLELLWWHDELAKQAECERPAVQEQPEYADEEEALAAVPAA